MPNQYLTDYDKFADYSEFENQLTYDTIPDRPEERDGLKCDHCLGYETNIHLYKVGHCVSYLCDDCYYDYRHDYSEDNW